VVSPFLMVLERAEMGRGVPLVVLVVVPLPVTELPVAELPEDAVLPIIAELPVDEFVIAELSVAELFVIAELPVAELLDIAELSVDELLDIAELSVAPLPAVELSVAELPVAPFRTELSVDELSVEPLLAELPLPELLLAESEDELLLVMDVVDALLALLSVPLLASREYASAPSAANARIPKIIGRTDFFSPSSRAIGEMLLRRVGPFLMQVKCQQVFDSGPQTKTPEFTGNSGV